MGPGIRRQIHTGRRPTTIPMGRTSSEMGRMWVHGGDHVMVNMAMGFDHDEQMPARSSRAELIAAVATCLAHDAEDCIPYLVAPMHDSKMTAHKGRVITKEGKR